MDAAKPLALIRVVGPGFVAGFRSGNDWGNNGFGFFFQRNWNSQPANTGPRAGQYYQPMQQRWW